MNNRSKLLLERLAEINELLPKTPKNSLQAKELKYEREDLIRAINYITNRKL